MRRSVLITLAASALALGPTTASATADTPPETGCPASNEVLIVADLTALGYRLPARLDSEGNNNGLICAKQLNPQAQENACSKNPCPVAILYYFRDDDLTR